jgi:hypothetical protein
MNTYSANRSFSNIASSVSLIQEEKRKKTLCKRGIGDVTVDSALKPLVNKRVKFQIKFPAKRYYREASLLSLFRHMLNMTDVV